jgi:hypothetical protein
MIAPMVLLRSDVADILEPDTDDLPATAPCWHQAGTAGRIETYRKRVERGEPIFHPHDSTEVMPKFAFTPETGPSKWGR